MKIFNAIFRVKKEVKKAKNNTILSIDTKNWASAEEAVEEMYVLLTLHDCILIKFTHTQQISYF